MLFKHPELAPRGGVRAFSQVHDDSTKLATLKRRHRVHLANGVLVCGSQLEREDEIPEPLAIDPGQPLEVRREIEIPNQTKYADILRRSRERSNRSGSAIH